MPTKAGKVQLNDLRAGKTIFILGFEFFPAFRRVIPYLKPVLLDNAYIRSIPKEQWKEILAENRVYKSRHAGERYLRLHGKDMLRAENRWQMEVLTKHSHEDNQEVRVYSPEEVDSWLTHCEELYDWQIETFRLALPMAILMQGMHIKLRSYVKQKVLDGQGRDILAMTTIEDPVAKQVNQREEVHHEQPAGSGGQAV